MGRNRIIQTWINEDKNIVVNSVAGSGKTTLILDLVGVQEKKSLVLAFNKSIQEELNLRLSERGLLQGKAQTLHSLGLSAIRRVKPKLKINSGKNYKLLRRFENSNPTIYRGLNFKDKLKLNYLLMDINDVSRLFMTNNLEEIERNMQQMGKIFSEVSIDLDEAWENLLRIREEELNHRNLEIDFIDMLYVPVYKDLYIPSSPELLFIDEAQDLSYIQHLLIDKFISQGDIKKWIAVGDSRQSIYAFSGAYTSSFETFQEKENTECMTLNLCYRCPTKVIESANQIYDVMLGHKQEEGIVGNIQSITEIKPGSMVICRNTKPLFKLYFDLLAEGKKCYIEGEDILSSLKSFLRPYANLTIGSASNKISQEIIEEQYKNPNSLAAYILSENFEIFQSIIKALKPMSFEKVSSLFVKIDSIFEKREDAIMLCTIHKSKGLQNDVVYILNEHLIPSKFAITSEQLQQERNLKYVARTRSENEMYFLNLDI